MTTKTLPRLAARFRPERFRLLLVVLLIVSSFALSAAGPLILAAATNLLVGGLIGGLIPADVTKAQVITALHQYGQGHIADLLSGVNFTPGVGVNFTRIGEVLGLGAGVYLLAAVAGWGQGYIMAGVAQRAIFRLRQEAEEKLTRLPLRYFDSRPHGEVLSRFTNDIDNLGGVFESGLIQLLSSLLTMFGALGIMFWISPLLAAVALAMVPLAIVASAPMARRTQTLFDAEWDRTAALNGLVEETHTGHDLVMAFGQRQPMIEEFGRKNELLNEASFRAGVISGSIGPVVSLIGNLNFVAIAAVGGYQVAIGAITLGGVQALIQYSRQFSGPVSELAGQLGQLQSGYACAKRVFDLLDTPEETATRTAPGAGAALADLPGASRRVELRNVSFRYDPDTPLIEDFTLEAAPGQTVAIVGPTGAGKTTVVNLLVRFYEIQGGQILLDGVDYKDLSRDEVRRCFGMVLQDTWLFAGTIWDNIAYGRLGATDEEIRTAAEAAYADQFVRTLPDGYATVLDGEASSLSAGQKQLLTIARAFLANPGILILDEATSNVDTRTEILIQNAMARLRSGRTSFVIAHRLSTIRGADTIVVMDAGRIVEQGSHEELLILRGFYHHLYYSQFARAVAQ
jgi:ATP-binding cassette subfamily B protein